MDNQIVNLVIQQIIEIYLIQSVFAKMDIMMMDLILYARIAINFGSKIISILNYLILVKLVMIIKKLIAYHVIL